jgi:hypothetical protein
MNEVGHGLDSPGVCPGGDVIQVVLQDPAGDHGIFLACSHGGIVGEHSGLRPGVICYNMFCYTPCAFSNSNIGN